MKIIGVTIETRPDTINFNMIKHLREIGCTRIQIGVQHIDDFILKKINRKAYLSDTINAIYLLKNCGYKIDIHLMPNLPYSNVEKDLLMFERVINDQALQVDQWKIYPCEIVPWTKIKDWYEEGKYTPYNEEELTELLIKIKTKVPPYIRLNRVIRDIPTEYILGGFGNPSLRDVIFRKMCERGLKCNCIRCREVKGEDIYEPKLFIRKYLSSFGKEYYISYESSDGKYLYGHIRLRIPDKNFMISKIFPEIPDNISWIRELHVYGKINTTYEKTFNAQSQHKGFGTKLLKEAEKISRLNGRKDIVVIAGDGTRKYYEKRGYKLLESGYMIKNIRINLLYAFIEYFLQTIYKLFLGNDYSL